MLGFGAVGQLALGQLPQAPAPTTFDPQWPSVKAGYKTDSFSSFVFIPQAQVFVFSNFSQPLQTKAPQQTTPAFAGKPVVVTLTPVFSEFSRPLVKSVQQTDTNFRILVPTAATPTSLVFTRFSEPSFTKVRQQSNTNSSFFVQPITPTVIVGGDFADFDLVKSRSIIQTGFTNTPFVPQVQNYVFSRFEQPQSKRILQQDQSFVNIPVVQVVIQPYVFGQFSQPLTKRIQQADSSFVNLPVIVTPVINFTGFVDSQPQQKRFIDGFITSINPLPVQTYVFTQFSQPQSKKTNNDQFTWFTSTNVYQPYVFSSFSQPSGVRYQTDSQFEFALQPVVIITPPVFTGFNDFGLTQQVLGSQKQQDASSVQFSILPMPQIISVVNFTGFSDFNNQLRTSYRVEQHPQVDFFIFVPIIPVSITTGGKRWVTELETKKKKLKAVPLESSTIKEITHDKDSNELVVKFKSDRVYHYRDVHSKRVKGLLKTKSPGGYLHKNIKGKYLTTRIK